MAELLIPVAIALAGMQLNRRARPLETEEVHVPGDIDQSFRDPDPVARQFQESVAAHMSRNAQVCGGLEQDLAREGFTDFTYANRGGLVPFFRTDATMNDISGVAERKLGTFTGSADQLEYRPRDAVGNPFQPVPQGNRSLESFLTAKDRFEQVPNIKVIANNVKPFEDVKVGPGLGLGYDKVSRDTGYQEMNRYMPENVSGYRRHSHLGRVIPGATINAEGTTRVENFRAPSTDLSQAASELTPFGGIAHDHLAFQHRSDIVERPTQRRHAEAPAQVGRGDLGETFRGAEHTNLRVDESARDFHGITQGPGRGGYAVAGLQVHGTDRGEANRFVGGGAVGTRGEASRGEFTLSTHRAGHCEISCEGGYDTKNFVRGGFENSKEKWRDLEFDFATNREQESSILGGYARDGGYHRQTNFEIDDKRSSALYSHFPGTQRRGGYADNQDRFTGAVSGREPIQSDRLPQQTAVYESTRTGVKSEHSFGRKLESDSALARDEVLRTAQRQLRDNPYHIDIAGLK